MLYTLNIAVSLWNSYRMLISSLSETLKICLKIKDWFYWTCNRAVKYKEIKIENAKEIRNLEDHLFSHTRVLKQLGLEKKNNLSEGIFMNIVLQRVNDECTCKHM